MGEGRASVPFRDAGRGELTRTRRTHSDASRFSVSASRRRRVLMGRVVAPGEG